MSERLDDMAGRAMQSLITIINSRTLSDLAKREIAKTAYDIAEFMMKESDNRQIKELP
jgi:hypothetical protein